MWTPVTDSVYLQAVEGRLETEEPVLAAAVQDARLYVGSRRGVERLEDNTLVAVALDPPELSAYAGLRLRKN